MSARDHLAELEEDKSKQIEVSRAEQGVREGKLIDQSSQAAELTVRCNTNRAGYNRGGISHSLL